LRKAVAEYKYDATRIVDLARAYIVYQDLEGLEDGVCKFLKWLGENKKSKEMACSVLRVKDRFSNGPASGYNDVLVNIKCKFGQAADHKPAWYVAEVQFQLCGLLYANNAMIADINKKWGRTQAANNLFPANGHDEYDAVRPKIAQRKAELKKPLNEQNAQLILRLEQEINPIVTRLRALMDEAWNRLDGCNPSDVRFDFDPELIAIWDR